jgi:hypothetical protein
MEFRVREGICRYPDGVYRDGDQGLLIRELTTEEALRHVELLLDQERKNWREELERNQAVVRERDKAVAALAAVPPRVSFWAWLTSLLRRRPAT